MASFPKTPGACIDLAYNLREERLEYQRAAEAKLEEMKKREAAINQHIIDSFSKDEITQSRGSTATASVSSAEFPTVKDWPKAFAWISKHSAWDLMEKRMAALAWRDRTAGGKKIPGVESYTRGSLSLTRIAGKKEE